MKASLALLCALLIAALAPLPAVAQTALLSPAPPPAQSRAAPTAIEARAAQVVALLNGALQPADVFTDGFRAAVADAQIRDIASSITAQFGRALQVAVLSPTEGTSANFEIWLERGIAKGRITIAPDDSDRISGLFFASVDSRALEGDTPEQIAADLAALPGSVNAWFGPLGGAPVISRDAAVPLALGSTFKLYVLAALAEDVQAGRRNWSDVVALTVLPSYPSGKMQDWPHLAPVTQHTLATLMVSISDNTATDQLIEELGKHRVLKLMQDSGHRNAGLNDPLLNTRDLFVIKSSEGLIDLWRRSDASVKSTLVERLSFSPSLDQVNAAFANGPKALDIEWFASPDDLAKLFVHMRKTADPRAFEIMAINPSATGAILANWQYVGFKGGSEPGVLNLTWLLTDKAGRDWVLTLGWNNPAAVVDEGKLEAIAQRILLLPR
jgi:Beta-lactamase enzyme family